jgi:hypothetical protein
MADDLLERIVAFLDSHHVMSLATVGPQGPHAANVFYARDGLALLFVSDAASRHSVELEADARAAATIATDYADFAAIRGLQLSGRACHLVDAPERLRAKEILEARYGFLRLAADETMLDRYARAQMYRFDADRVVLIDNRRGFGHRETYQPS